MVCHGLGSSVLQAVEWNAMAEGTLDKVWACRRSKVLLLGTVRGGGVEHHRNLPEQAHSSSQKAGHLWCRLWVVRSHLLRLQGTSHFLCRLQVDGYLLCGLKASGG